METNKYNLIFTIVNRGFSDEVMNAARERGATGGTVLHGKGSGAKELLQFHNLIIEDEKEAVMIVAGNEIKNSVMDGIMHASGITSQAQGIVFSLPVEDFVVLNKPHDKAEKIDNIDKTEEK